MKQQKEPFAHFRLFCKKGFSFGGRAGEYPELALSLFWIGGGELGNLN